MPGVLAQNGKTNVAPGMSALIRALRRQVTGCAEAPAIAETRECVDLVQRRAPRLLGRKA
jgi:hypothetical protein